MAFKSTAGNNIIRSTPTTATELLAWAASHHQASATSTSSSSLESLKGFVIPNIFPRLELLWKGRNKEALRTTSGMQFKALLSRGGKHNQPMRLIRYQSSTAANKGVGDGDRSSFLLDSSKERLISLLNQKRFTASDLAQLTELSQLLVTSVTSSTEFNSFIYDHKAKVYEILLRYRQNESLQKLIRSQMTQSYEEKLTLIKVLIQTKQSTQIQDIIKTMSREDLKQLVSDITAYFIFIKKPIRAYELWLYVTSQIYPDMKIANHAQSRHFMDKLQLILNKVNVVNDILTLSDRLLPDLTQRQNLSYTLSFAYVRSGQHKSNVNLWNFTDPQCRSLRQLSNTISSYLTLNQYQKAYELWLTSASKSDSTSLSHIVRSFHTITDLNTISQETLHDILRTGLIKTRHFKPLLYKTIEQQKVRPAYELCQTQLLATKATESIDMINLLLEHSKEQNEYDFFQSKMVELGPNSRSLLIILKDFTRTQDLSSALNLLEVMAQQERASTLLRIDHFTEVLNLLIAKPHEVSEVNETLKKLTKLMKDYDLKPDQRYAERLITLKYHSAEYEQVGKLYQRYAKAGVIDNATVGMLSTVMRSLFKVNKFDSAKLIWNEIEERVIDVNNIKGKDSGYYLVKLEYLGNLGRIHEIKAVLEIMKADGIVVNSKHQHLLLSALNRKGYHAEVIERYSSIAEGEGAVTGTLYRDLIVALVKLEIVNRGNFDKPELIATQLLKSPELKTKFKVIKPLVNSLTRFHKQDKALELIVKYEKTNAEEALVNTLNMIKQKILIFSKDDSQWDSFKLLFDQFQHLVREILSDDDKAPPKLKKVYGPLIKSLVRYYESKKKTTEFASMFHDLVFIHNFTFDSNTYNFVVRHLLKNRLTFSAGLTIIERKLIGGYISNTNFALHKRAIIARGYEAHGLKRVNPPYIAWGSMTRESNVSMIYAYILRTVRDNKVTVEDVIEKDLKMNYPKLMNNIERKLTKRLEGRDRALLKKKDNLEERIVEEK